MNKKRIYVIGAGGHAKVIISSLISIGLKPEGIFDDDRGKIGKYILDIPVIGTIEEARSVEGNFIIGIGDNKVRKKISQLFDDEKMVKIIHPYSYVDPMAKIGAGTVVFAGAIVQSGTLVGNHSILNTGCKIDHDCILGDFCHVAPGVSLAGGVILEEGVFIGIGSCVIPGIKIGEWSQIGAGSVVVEDIPPHVLAFGNPARVIREIGNE